MKIITAIDFSTATEPVLKTTKIYAKLLQAEVYLVHVEPAKRTSKKPLPKIAELDQPAVDTRPEFFRLEKDAKALQRCGIPTVPVLLEGPVNQTILDQAATIRAELIITGSHGHNIMPKTSVGSTSEGLLRLSKIPVLVVPSGR